VKQAALIIGILSTSGERKLLFNRLNKRAIVIYFFEGVVERNHFVCQSGVVK
jgi:hypothetical protein